MNNEKDTLEKKLKNYIDSLTTELLDLFTIVHIFKYISNNNEIINEYNIAPCFFGTVENSLFTKIILWTHNLLDVKGQRSFFGFLDFCEKNISLFNKQEILKRCEGRNIYIDERDELTLKEIDELKQQLLNLNIINSIKIRRDKYHGHFDKKYFFLDTRKNIDDDAPLKWSEINEMLNKMKYTINYISNKYNANSNTFSYINKNDVEEVFNILKEHREKLKKEAIDAGIDF